MRSHAQKRSAHTTRHASPRGVKRAASAFSTNRTYLPSVASESNETECCKLHLSGMNNSQRASYSEAHLIKALQKVSHLKSTRSMSECGPRHVACCALQASHAACYDMQVSCRTRQYCTAPDLNHSILIRMELRHECLHRQWSQRGHCCSHK